MSSASPSQPSLQRMSEFDAMARLRSNAACSPTERDEIAAFRRGFQADIAQHDREAAKLRGQLLRIEHQKTQLAGCISFCDYLDSPVRRLPTEVLSNIFYFLPRNKLSNWRGVKKKSSFQSDRLCPKEWTILGRTLERVCSRWRTVAQATTALWASIYVSITDRDSMRAFESRMLYLVEMLLQRSKNSPLSIEVRFVDKGSVNQPVWHRLLDNRHRWRRAVVSDRDLEDGIERVFRYVEPCPLPLLEYLSFNVCYDSQAIFMHAPRLKSFVCHGKAADEAEIPCDQITSLKIADFGVDDASLSFQHYENATNVTFKLDPAADRGDYLLPPQCKSLVLDVRLCDEEVPMSSLISPSTLATLTITSSELHDAYILTAPGFQAFLNASQFTLTSLTLENIPMAPETFLSVLELVPHLTHLHIEEYDEEIGEDIPVAPFLLPAFLEPLGKLRPLGGGFVILPNLTHLVLKTRSGGVKDSQIVDAILCRALEGLQFLRLHLKDRWIGRKEFDRLRDVTGPSFVAQVTSAVTSKSQNDASTDRW